MTNSFVQPPGDIFYYAVVALTLSAGLAVALGQLTRRPQSRTASRYSLAIGGALLGWLAVIGGALFAVFTQQDGRSILPPLERAVTVAVMLLMGWAFLTADSERRSSTISFGLFVLLVTTVIGYIITGLQWAELAPVLDFNLSQLGVLWAFIQGIVALGGLLLVLIYARTTLDVPLKFVFFALLLMGFAGTLWQMSNGVILGDYSGFSRLGMALASVIIPLVIYRKVIYGYELTLDIQGQSLSQPVQPHKATQTAPQVEKGGTSSMTAQPFSKAEVTPQSSSKERESVQLLKAMGLILEEARPADIPLRIVKATLEVLKADVGALLNVKNAHYTDILIAYDRALDRPIPAMLSLNREHQVTLNNAIERKDQRPLFLDRNPDELEDLYTRLDMEGQIGPAYFQPLMRDNDLIAVLMVGLPYAKRDLRDSERELLKGIGIISGSLLALSDAASDAEMRAEERAIQAMVAGLPLDDIGDGDVLAAHQEMQSALEAARQQNRELQKQTATLRIELDRERSRLMDLLQETPQDLSISQRIMAITDEQENLREQRDELTQRLQEAETALASATGLDDDALFQSMIETLNREKDELLTEMTSLRTQLDDIRKKEQNSAASDLLENMSVERGRLQSERDRLSDRLRDIEGQLEALGLEGGSAGLATVVQQLYDQRSALQVQSDALRVERDALLNERRRFEQRMRREEEREEQMETMEAEIRHLAADREAMTRQRDQMRQERDENAAKVDKLKEQRARLLAKISDREERLGETEEQLEALREKFRAVVGERNDIATERERLKIEQITLQNERDQLIARLDGDRGKIQQLGDDARVELMGMLAEITAQRDKLEAELNETLTEVAILRTEQEELHEQVTQAAQRPTSSNAALLMSMVQELRTPMTGVLGFVDLLVSESAGILSEPQRDFLQRISANIVRMETMINDIIHLTALDTHAYQLKLHSVNIVKMLEEAITHASYQFRDKGLMLDLQLDDDIPSLYADYNGLQQVIGQLLTNAYLASKEGGLVGIYAQQQMLHLPELSPEPVPAVVVSIADSGRGVLPDELDDVFAQRYRPEHRLITGLGDTGVGLTIAKALVEAHGGEMWVESEPDVGTTFRFALPMTLQPEPDHAT